MAIFLLAMLILASFGSGEAVVGLPDSARRDREALVAFAAAITSDPDHALADWGGPDGPVCNWTGVTCNPAKGRVVQLDLSGRNIGGVISPAVANLSFLVVLDLSNNYLAGVIPEEIGGLSRLKQLSLTENLLVGAVPPELGLLPRLVYLNLGGNRLSGWIPETLFCNCSSLQYMDLSNNSLVGEIPLHNQCKLSELRFLLLWSNNLTGPIPASISNSTQLEWIDLESNYLSGKLPSEIFDKTPDLQYLYLSYNNLTSHDANTNLDPFFASLANCSRLQELELAGNNLGGEIPPSIGYLSGSLQQLHLEDNLIHGPIRSHILNLVNLTYLNLSNNYLNGSIPRDISRLKKLERAYLSNNLLSGEIPASLGDIPHLGLLDMSGNMLSGSIPDSVGNLPQLRRLMLHNNRLSGMIPRSLGNCMNLEILDLSYNRLSGWIPAKVAGLASLKLYLNLSSNLLGGPLPLELSKMDMILALDLSQNNFSGMIPPQLGSCIAIEYLNLSGNRFHGNLPSSVGALPYLKALDVSSNRLGGVMPESLQASSSLKLLNLSFNNFLGALPTTGVFASLSVASFLGNPNLCGSMPGMPLCAVNRAHRSMTLPVLLTLIVTPFILCIIAYIIVRRSRSRSQLPEFIRTASVLNDVKSKRKQDYPRISYRQLMVATEGFSRSNLIGSGRFGQVYKGILPDKTMIAVKVLDAKKDSEISGSFRRECQVLKSTRHRNLIKIITACSKPDFKALVLPLMMNGSLEDHLYPVDDDEQGFSHGLTLVQLVSIASDVAEGMAYLHHYSPVRVFHCDLKPSNVLLDEDMTALVSDFGIARLVNGVGGENDDIPDTSSCNSATGLLCGSIGYIAPEYGMGGHPSAQGDVYSFGVLLLEMISGKRPTNVIFQEGLTLHEWVKRHYPNNVEPIIAGAPVRDSPVADSLYYKKLRRDVMFQLIELGLVCTQYSPSTRPNMVDVAHELALLKEDLSDQNAISDRSYLIQDCLCEK